MIFTMQRFFARQRVILRHHDLTQLRWAMALVLSATLLTARAEEPGSSEPTAAAEETPVVERVHKPQRGDLVRSTRLVSELSDRDPLTQAHWFNADDDEQRFLGLYHADQSGSAKGNLLILHDSRHHPDWPGPVRELRRHLAKHGWHTLSLAVPDYWPADTVPERHYPEPPSPVTGAEDESASPSSTAAATPTPDPGAAAEPMSQQVWQQREVEVAPSDYPQAFAERIQAGLGYLREQAGLPIVAVAIGTSASWFSGFLEANPGTIQGFVMVDIAEPPGTERALNTRLAELALPILDLTPERAARHDPQLRLSVMTQRQRNQYEQRTIPGRSVGTATSGDWIARTVRGWTERQMQAR